MQEVDHSLLFVDKEISNSIYSVVNGEFPKLQEREKSYLILSVELFLDSFARISNFQSGPFFGDKGVAENLLFYKRGILSKNNHVIRMVLFSLLPHIKLAEKKTKVSLLNEIYTKRNSSEEPAPEYKYCNIQYDHCLLENGIIKELEFHIDHLQNTLFAFFDSLKYCYCKLLPNYVDIFPFGLDNYKSSTLYINTKKEYLEHRIKDWDLTSEVVSGKLTLPILNKTNGLYVGILYDTLSVLIFQSIYKIKWLIYDIVLEDFTTTVYDILNNLVDFENFEPCWLKIVNSCESGSLEIISPNGGKVYILRGVFLYVFLEALITGFDRYFKEEAQYIKFIPLKSYPGDDQTFEENKVNSLTRDMLIKSFRSVNHKDFYDFYLSSVDSYKKSTLFNFEPIGNLSKKNYYNYIKLLIHGSYVESGGSLYKIKNKKDSKPTFARMPLYWKSLSSVEKQEFLKKINDKSGGWFNIKGYIRNYLFAKEGEVDSINSEIFRTAYDDIINLVFYSLVLNGVLSYYYPAKTIEINSLINEQIGNHFGDNASLKEKKEFWDYLGKPENTKDGNVPWNYRKTMDLVPQLSFCDKMLHHRIHFITAGTGVGKSTVIPMLYMYFLKALFYKLDGKVVCCQPRIDPVNNAFYNVCKQLGISKRKTSDKEKEKLVGLFSSSFFDQDTSSFLINIAKNDTDVYNSLEKEISIRINDENIEKLLKDKIKHIKDTRRDTSNFDYLVQKEYKGVAYSSRESSLTLKFMTDGTLIRELSTSNGIKRVNNKIFTKQNIYDIVIVDEANEHGTNMDKILTLGRNICYANNSVIFSIMSATIEQDEAIYRRFYRCINDDMKYPININAKVAPVVQDAKSYYKSSYKKHINLSLLDRRLHVHSETTFEITDVYVPEAAKNVEDFVVTIMRNIKGIGLLFLPTVKMIKKSIVLLNEKLPIDTIAIPFFREMNDITKETIKDIDKLLSKIKINKHGILSGVVGDGNIFIGSNTYTKCVIVATNIAEASVTIGGLEVVFDTGFQNTKSYNTKARKVVFSKESIAESNRIQRRGRIGRLFPGTCYYLYPLGEKEGYNTKYNISSEDLTYDILGLLKDPVVDYMFSIGGKHNDINDARFNKLILEESLQKYIAQNYYCGGNNSLFFTGKYSPLKYKVAPYYFSGYDGETLIDEDGSFYLIHPDENLIKRDIFGKIVEVQIDGIWKKSNKIISIKMLTFVDNLVNSMLVNKTSHITKSKIGQTLGVYLRELLDIQIFKANFTEEEVLLLMASASFGCFDEIVIYLSNKNSKISYDISKMINYYKPLFITDPLFIRWKKELEKTKIIKDKKKFKDRMANLISRISLETNNPGLTSYISLYTDLSYEGCNIQNCRIFEPLIPLIGKKEEIQAAFVFAKSTSLLRELEDLTYISFLYPTKDTIQKIELSVPQFIEPLSLERNELKGTKYLILSENNFVVVNKEVLSLLVIKIDTSTNQKVSTILEGTKLNCPYICQNSLIDLKKLIGEVLLIRKQVHKHLIDIMPEISSYIDIKEDLLRTQSVSLLE